MAGFVDGNLMCDVVAAKKSFEFNEIWEIVLHGGVGRWVMMTTKSRLGPAEQLNTLVDGGGYKMQIFSRVSLQMCG